jgi:hypothetical protein
MHAADARIRRQRVALPSFLSRMFAPEPRFQELAQRICIPEIARLITSRWISEVPSKMV